MIGAYYFCPLFVCLSVVNFTFAVTEIEASYLACTLNYRLNDPVPRIRGTGNGFASSRSKARKLRAQEIRTIFG